MVYIYKKPIGNKNYYYLRASEKKGKKLITKDIAYLGSTIEEVKSNMDKLSIHKDKIRKSYKIINSFLEENHFLEKAKKLKLKKDIFLKDKTEEIEACKINYSEVFDKLEEATNLLNEGITPKNKTLREVYDLQNTEKVFFELLNNKLKEKFGHELIIEIHDNLLDKIDERKGYRNTDIRVVRSNFDASPGKYVKTDMELLLKWFNENQNKLHPIVLAVIFHHKFEKIHPFMDGNGRTGRMIINYILLKSNLPPTIIHKKTRKEYLESMREADKCDLWKVSERYNDLIDYGIEEFLGTYWNIFL